MNSTEDNIREQIKLLFINNEFDDLKHMLSKRKYLNMSNMAFVYSYHIAQASGILITALAAGYDYKVLIWVGIGFNIGAALLNRFEHINNSMSDRLLKDIIAIKEGKYVDEGNLVDPDTDNVDTQSNKNNNKTSV